MKNITVLQAKNGVPSPIASLTPILFLIGSLVLMLACGGVEMVGSYGWSALLCSAVLALILSRLSRTFDRKELSAGMRLSASQVLPALPLLLLIALISTTWMLSGVVPTLICYGLKVINPTLFPMLACLMTALVSSLTGSSWTAIATAGVAFMGIGGALDYSAAITAGAIVSGAYFGDKVSPLSDTTVVAASTCGVELFRHVRYMMFTALPAMLLTLAFYLVAGLLHGGGTAVMGEYHVVRDIEAMFFVHPIILFIPAVTVIMIALRIRTATTLTVSACLGAVGIIVFQGGVTDLLGGAAGIVRALWAGPEFSISSGLLERLLHTSGVLGMWPTALLVLSALVFGGVMIGTGMIASLTETFTHRLRSRGATVGATAGSGLLLVACTADQYLSLIVGGNMYNRHYESKAMEPRLLSRTLEDSVTVTSPLVPWSSCGVMQGSVLGVSALAYAPFALFCWLSPLLSVLLSVLHKQKE